MTAVENTNNNNNKQNSIFVVGFPQAATKEDLQAFFEKNLSGDKNKIASISVLKGRRIRRGPKNGDKKEQEQEQEQQLGNPFAFITFETEAGVQAALDLINKKRDALGEFAANIKVEQAGQKDRSNNSLYVRGFKYTDSIAQDLTKFFAANLNLKTIEVDVRRVQVPVDGEVQDKSYALVFCPNAEIKKAALLLKGGKVGASVLDIQERVERKPRRRPEGSSSKSGAAGAAGKSGRSEQQQGSNSAGRGRGGRGRGRGRGARGRGGRGGRDGRGGRGGARGGATVVVTKRE